MIRRNWTLPALMALLMAAALTSPALAQDTDQPPGAPATLAVFAQYPVRVMAAGDSVNFDITLRGGAEPRTLFLSLEDLPEGWEATFRGGGDVIEAVHVEAESSTVIDLRVEPPSDVAVNTYDFNAVAGGASEIIKVPLSVVVKEKVPPSLSFEVDLPTLKGQANTTFRYDATLVNDGDEELSINLIAEAPEGFQVDFRLTGQEVASFPIAPGETKRLDIEVQPPDEIPGDTYEIDVLAQGGAAQASTTIVADVTETPGTPSLNVTEPGGRLSGEATVGEETPLDIIVQNAGDAPARNVTLSGSQPSGWSVEFQPQQIDQIAAGSQAQVTARVKPADMAVAGDYEITIRAQPEDGTAESAQFRITVRTSTLWGIVGIAIIAVAVVVVGLAVVRFGRR